MNAKSWLGGREDAVYRQLAEYVAAGQDVALVTVIAAAGSTPRGEGAKLLVRADGAITGTVGGGPLEELARAAGQRALETGRCERIRRDLAGDLAACGGSVELFVEPVLGAATCWVFGAGHIGQALVRAGRDLPWRFVVVDDRRQMLAEITGARTLAAAPETLLDGGFTVQPRAAAVVASRDHRLDADYVGALLNAEQQAGCELAYLGIVGSERKARTLRARFAADAHQRDRLDRARMPVGLELGAETPAEIAISILAELIAVQRDAVPLTDAAGRALGLPFRRHRAAAASNSEPGA